MKKYVKCLIAALLLSSSASQANNDIVSDYETYYNWFSYWDKLSLVKATLWNECMSRGFDQAVYGKVRYQTARDGHLKRYYKVSLTAKCKSKT